MFRKYSKETPARFRLFHATRPNKIASDRNICIKLEESAIPVEETVRSALRDARPRSAAIQNLLVPLSTASEVVPWQLGHIVSMSKKELETNSG